MGWQREQHVVAHVVDIVGGGQDMPWLYEVGGYEIALGVSEGGYNPGHRIELP